MIGVHLWLPSTYAKIDIAGMNSSDGQPLLQVRDLQKLFPIRKGFWRRTVGYVRAVDGVSFSLHEGETLGLVGESGCGKTTTARCILRAIEPTAGQVLFRTQAGYDRKSARLNSSHRQNSY